MAEPKTLTITNLGGPLTRRNTGDINSGLTRYDTSWGYDPYSKPGNLTWLEQPVSVLSVAVATHAMKQRIESNVNYVYALGSSNDNLYRITVNSSSNPDVNTASVLGTLGADAYDGGGGIAFYGSTEKIFYGGDRNIAKINFNGSSSSILASSSEDQPRPMVQFIGKIYFGYGNNIGEIDSTETVTTVAKLNPALPSGLYVKDLTVSADGNYLQIIASRTNSLNAIGTGTAIENTTMAAAVDAFKFYWNGIDPGITALDNFSGTVLSANVTRANMDYMFGYDSAGTAIFSGTEKIVSLPRTFNPEPNATFLSGAMLGFIAPEYEPSSGRVRASFYHYGQYDSETPRGLYRLLRHNSPLGDFVGISTCIPVSNRLYVPEHLGFSNNLAQTGKIYYSTNEYNSIGNDNAQRIWRFYPVPRETSGLLVGSILAGVYETQSQLFSKKVKVSEVRVYTEPLIGGNDFIVDLIGSGGSVISGGSQRFQVATGSIVAGTDMVHFNPAMVPTYAIGVRITNSSVTGVANWTARKLEIDYTEGGK